MAKAIAQGSSEVEAIFFTPGPVNDGTRTRYAPFRVIEAPSSDLKSAVRALRAAITETDPDVVHAHGTRAKIILWLAFLYPGKRPRAIYTVHGFHIMHRPFPRKQLAMLLEWISNRWMDEIVTTNVADRDAVIASKTAPANKIVVVYNGVDVAKFSGGSREAGREFAGVGSAPVVLVVARLHPQKDIETALRAWKIVRAKHPSAIMLVNGDGPLESELKDLASELNLGESVRFLGYATNVPDLLAASDVVLLPTHWEGMALVPLEAGAASRPMVGTDVPGMSETVLDGKTGYLVRHADPEDLAAKLSDLLSHPDQARAMGETGKKIVLEKFTEEKMAKAYLVRYAFWAGR